MYINENIPLVTIICLSYNHEKYVIESLNSIINQTYPAIEILIVDDYSTDNSVEVINSWLKNYPNVTFIKNEKNIGNTKAFNKALAIAKGDYIIDLAADDILENNCVALQIECFNTSKYKNLGLVYGNAQLLNNRTGVTSYYFNCNSDGKTIEKRTTGNAYLSIISGGNSICSVSAMIKISVLNKLNGYDENLYYEDLDLWIRLSRTYEIDYIDASLVKKRILENSLGTNFYNKKSKASKKINNSTFLILSKSFHLNRNKQEDLGLLKRIHFEMVLNFKNTHYSLVVKYLILEVRTRLRIYFKNEW